MAFTSRVLLAFCLGLSVLAQTRAQIPAVPPAGTDAAMSEEIVIGSRILAEFGVLDGFGHVSARSPADPNHFLMSRSLAPAAATAGGPTVVVLPLLMLAQITSIADAGALSSGAVMAADPARRGTALAATKTATSG